MNQEVLLMYTASSRSTGLPPEQQHGINKSRLENLNNTLTPIATAAANLANTARTMKQTAESRKSAGNKVLFDSNHRSITTKELIASLKSAKDALKNLASKSTSLARDVQHMAGHQEGLYSGNMRGIPLGDKVNWCTRQVDNLTERGHKLGQRQLPDIRSALARIDQASSFLPGGVGYQNREIVGNLERLSRM
jgi:hypothetical protein